MSVLGTLILALARRLPVQERQLIAMQLSESVHDRAIVAACPDDPVGDEPDWKYVSEVMSEAVDHADRIETLLSSERAYFDFGDLSHAATDLGAQLDKTHRLLCEAGNLGGLALHAGANLAQVQKLVGQRRAEIFDAQLAPLRPAVGPSAPVWTVEFDKHGGFVATTTQHDDVAPWKFHGRAATAASAVHTLQWTFLDEPPHVNVDPPVGPQPLAGGGPGADRSREGPAIPELLARRGSLYQQHHSALQAARDRLRDRPGRLQDYLAERAAELNTSDPQLPGSRRALDTLASAENGDHDGVAYTVMWVPTTLVVATSHRVWGDFGGFRDEVPFDIATGLLSTDDPEAFTEQLFRDPIVLQRSPGWAGPLYQVGSNGNHRVHSARMLGLPWLAAEVESEATAPGWSTRTLVTADPHTDRELRRPFQERLDERAAALLGRIRRAPRGTSHPTGPRSRPGRRDPPSRQEDLRRGAASIGRAVRQ
ncbi:hypothetical protein L3Q67_26200 [Saccharothrix sp. AJ9571]|nr:hypothetical protein L3Q67_26200 [Saccharothrix sp. AJ9571]